MLTAREFDRLPGRVEIPADLATILYTTIKEQEEWTCLHAIAEELKTQTVTMSPEMVVWIYHRLLDKKKMNLLVGLYDVLKGQVGK